MKMNSSILKSSEPLLQPLFRSLARAGQSTTPNNLVRSLVTPRNRLLDSIFYNVDLKDQQQVIDYGGCFAESRRRAPVLPRCGRILPRFVQQRRRCCQRGWGRKFCDRSRWACPRCRECDGSIGGCDCFGLRHG
jgi:hypothetical protein